MQSIYTRIQQEYENNRNSALQEVERKKEELYKKEPKLLEIDEKIKKIGMEMSKSIIFIDDDTKRENTVKDLNSQIDALKDEKNKLLKKLKLPEDYLVPNFKCKVCEDTGIIGSITGSKSCSCFRQKLIDYTYNQAQIYNIDKENFDTFDEKGARKFFNAEGVSLLKKCRERVAATTEAEFNEANLEKLYNAIAEEEGVALGKVIQPSRLALSGRTVTPGMFDVMVLLGKNKTLERMDQAIAFAEKM